MHRVILSICLSVAAAGCGSSLVTNDVSGPVAACESFAYASCNRLSQCQTAVAVSSCAQLLSNKVGCSHATCGTGTFSPTGAQACLDAYNAQPCPDAIGNVTPTECSSGSTICI